MAPLKACDGSFLSAKNTISVNVISNNLDLQLWGKKYIFPKQWILSIKTLNFQSFHSQNIHRHSYFPLKIFNNILSCSFYHQIKLFVLKAIEIRILCLFRAQVHKQTFLLGRFSTSNTNTKNKLLKSKYFIVITSTQFRINSQFYYLHNFLAPRNSLLWNLFFSTWFYSDIEKLYISALCQKIPNILRFFSTSGLCIST